MWGELMYQWGVETLSRGSHCAKSFLVAGIFNQCGTLEWLCVTGMRGKVLHQWGQWGVRGCRLGVLLWQFPVSVLLDRSATTGLQGLHGSLGESCMSREPPIVSMECPVSCQNPMVCLEHLSFFTLFCVTRKVENSWSSPLTVV